MRNNSQQTEAFTLVEILVAAAIGAALITAAVIGFGTISQSPLRQGSVNVSLPAGVVQNLYGTNSAFITLGANPNYFQSAQARRLKDRLVSDAAAASAVFCLGRNLPAGPALRPAELVISNKIDFRTHATPDAFRSFLADYNGFAAVFPESQNDVLLGATNATTNATIFVVAGLESTRVQTNALRFVSVYEIDFVRTVQPAGGTVASVRRFSGTNTDIPTDYYHVYYPGETNGVGGFRPLAAFFGRAAATNNPFTFVWWPDPLVSKLGAGADPPVSEDSPRDNYSNMADRTSLFFVLPTFPSL